MVSYKTERISLLICQSYGVFHGILLIPADWAHAIGLLFIMSSLALLSF